jgi:hypothetical protein
VFASGSVHVGFVLRRVSLGQVFPRVLRFTLSISLLLSMLIYHVGMKNRAVNGRSSETSSLSHRMKTTTSQHRPSTRQQDSPSSMTQLPYSTLFPVAKESPYDTTCRFSSYLVHGLEIKFTEATASWCAGSLRKPATGLQQRPVSYTADAWQTQIVTGALQDRTNLPGSQRSRASSSSSDDTIITNSV